MNTVMDDLRKAIRGSGETPYAIAKGAGVDKSMLSRMLREERVLTLESAEKVAAYLGLEIVVKKRSKRKRD